MWARRWSDCLLVVDGRADGGLLRAAGPAHPHLEHHRHHQLRGDRHRGGAQPAPPTLAVAAAGRRGAVLRRRGHHLQPADLGGRPGQPVPVGRRHLLRRHLRDADRRHVRAGPLRGGRPRPGQPDRQPDPHLRGGPAVLAHGDLSVGAARRPDPVQKAVTIAYPISDVLVLALLAWLAVSVPHTRAVRLLGLGTFGLLAADVAYGYNQAGGAWKVGGPVDLGWIALYACWGAAALDPSMVAITDPRNSRPAGVTWARLTVLALCSMVAPAVLLVELSQDHADQSLLTGVLACWCSCWYCCGWPGRRTPTGGRWPASVDCAGRARKWSPPPDRRRCCRPSRMRSARSSRGPPNARSSCCTRRPGRSRPSWCDRRRRGRRRPDRRLDPAGLHGPPGPDGRRRTGPVRDDAALLAGHAGRPRRRGSRPARLGTRGGGAGAGAAGHP